MIVLLRPPIERVQNDGWRLVSGQDVEFRAYGVGTQILADPGVHNMTLLTNGHRNFVAIDEWGIIVSGEQNLLH